MPDVNGNVSEVRVIPPPDAYTMKKAAEILGVTDSAIYYRHKEGKIKLTEKNGLKMVPREEVERWLDYRVKREQKKTDYVRKQKAKAAKKVTREKKEKKLPPAKDVVQEMKDHLDNIPVYKDVPPMPGNTANRVPEVAGNQVIMIPAGTRFISLNVVPCGRRVVIEKNNVSIGITFHE